MDGGGSNGSSGAEPAFNFISDSLSPLWDYPADLLRLVIRRCPGKRKKVRKAHHASFVMHFPSGKGAGDEPMVLRFFVHDAEAGAWHRHYDLVVEDLDDNFGPLNHDSFSSFARLATWAAMSRARLAHVFDIASVDPAALRSRGVGNLHPPILAPYHA